MASVYGMLNSDYANFARDIAAESGELIKEHWARGTVQVDRKADKTVVTETDRAVETLMRERIKANYPTHGIIGEEFGNENEDAEYVWILDPIDGTVSYVHGIPLYGSLFGLLHHGQPIIGVIHQPNLGQLCIGDGKETLINGTPVGVSGKTDLAAATLLCTDPRRAETHQNGPAFQNLIQQVETYRGWGDCYGYLMVACGRADMMLDPVLSLWDLLPLIPIIRGAGGIITDFQGKDAVKGKSCVAATPALHPQIMDILNA